MSMRWQSRASVHPQVKPREKTLVCSEFLSEEGEGRKLLTLSEGSVVFSQGDSADSVFYIQTGKIKLTIASKTRKGATIEVLEAGGLFGEGCLAGQQRRAGTATTLSECLILRMERDAAAQALQTDAAFSELMLSHLLTRTNRIEEYLTYSLSSSKRDSRKCKPAGGASA